MHQAPPPHPDAPHAHIDRPPEPVAPPELEPQPQDDVEAQRQKQAQVEQDLPPVRWWHEWLCGCGEGPDRGGDHQVRLYSLRVLRAFRRTLIVLCFGNRPGARIRLSDRIVMLLRLRLRPFLVVYLSAWIWTVSDPPVPLVMRSCWCRKHTAYRSFPSRLSPSRHGQIVVGILPPHSHSCGQYGISIA